MQPDLEKYRSYLERFDLTDAEKDEFLLSMWTMLEGVADRAFGTHPFQQAVDNSLLDDSRDSGLRVELRDTNSKR